MQADKIYPNRELIMNKESRITEQSSLYDHLEEMSVEEHMEYYISQGIDKKEAMKKVAADRGVSKREIYQLLLEN